MQVKMEKNRLSAVRSACIALALLLSLWGLAGCAKTPAEGGRDADGTEPLRIVCTVFPAYDWIRNVLGENPAGIALTLLNDSGVDLHSYQPTAKDILRIADADLLVYVGGESDEWVEDAQKTAPDDARRTVNLLETLGTGAKEEEIVEGMQEDRDADHDGEDADGDRDHGDDENDHHHGDVEYDEHVWLSLRNAALYTDTLAEEIAALDPANAALYRANAAAYRETLAALDADYAETVRGGRVNTLLFADRFPFRYLTDDYGLDYYAAFVGCSAETEASFETIAFLARKTDELGLGTVLTIEGADHRLAETVVRTTAKRDQTIRTLDSMQSVTAGDVADGKTYLSVMEANLAVLAEALR